MFCELTNDDLLCIDGGGFFDFVIDTCKVLVSVAVDVLVGAAVCGIVTAVTGNPTAGATAGFVAAVACAKYDVGTNVATFIFG